MSVLTDRLLAAVVPQFQPKRGFELFRSFITATAPLY